MQINDNILKTTILYPGGNTTAMIEAPEAKPEAWPQIADLVHQNR